MTTHITNVLHRVTQSRLGTLWTCSLENNYPDFQKLDACYVAFMDDQVGVTRYSTAETLYPFMNLRRKDSCPGVIQQS